MDTTVASERRGVYGHSVGTVNPLTGRETGSVETRQ